MTLFTPPCWRENKPDGRGAVFTPVLRDSDVGVSILYEAAGLTIIMSKYHLTACFALENADMSFTFSPVWIFLQSIDFTPPATHTSLSLSPFSLSLSLLNIFSLLNNFFPVL